MHDLVVTRNSDALHISARVFQADNEDHAIFGTAEVTDIVSLACFLLQQCPKLTEAECNATA